MTEPVRSLAARYPRLRRASVLILVGGALAVWVSLKPHIPHDHPVAYRFDPGPGDVTGLEVVWTRADSPADEPVGGSRYQWSPGTAPTEVRATVRGPDGDYSVELTVHAGESRRLTTSRTALGDQITRVRAPVPASASPLPANSPSP